MQCFVLQIRPESPLAVQATRGRSNEAATTDVVPASTLRGALAAFMKRRLPEPDWLKLFGETGLRTSNLLPVRKDPENQLRARTAPLTLRTCKQYPGFAGEGHGVEDTLFGLIRYQLNGDLEALRNLQACPTCRAVLRPLRAVIGEASGQRWCVQPRGDRRVHVHVGFDRRRRGAASGILYSQEMLSEQSERDEIRLQALVKAPDALAEQVRNLLKVGTVLRIGHARSRGLGRCVIEALVPAPRGQSIAARITTFREAAASYGIDGAERLIALTLETPSFFVDEFLRPLTTPDGAALLQGAGASELDAASVLPRLEPVMQVARPYRWVGWNGLARVPATVEQGLAPGSVLVFRVPDRDDDFLEALSVLEEHGAGLMRHLGFGQVRVCDPIHAGCHDYTRQTA